jgi:hypothetical protein
VENPRLLQIIQGQKQTQLKLETNKKKSRPQKILSEEDLQRIEREKLKKSQMQLFQRHYSELVEKNSKNTITIKYPIED